MFVFICLLRLFDLQLIWLLSTRPHTIRINEIALWSESDEENRTRIPRRAKLRCKWNSKLKTTLVLNPTSDKSWVRIDSSNRLQCYLDCVSQHSHTYQVGCFYASGYVCVSARFLVSFSRRVDDDRAYLGKKSVELLSSPHSSAHTFIAWMMYLFYIYVFDTGDCTVNRRALNRLLTATMHDPSIIEFWSLDVWSVRHRDNGILEN